MGVIPLWMMMSLSSLVKLNRFFWMDEMEMGTSFGGEEIYPS
jgi:hypothetical protein